MRLHPVTGAAFSGVGARQAWTWDVDQFGPVSVGPGAAGGWRGHDYIGTSPRGLNFSPSYGPPWPSSLGFDASAANRIVAAAGKWIAWNPVDGSYGVGVPVGHEHWTPVGICDDGTVIMLLNGVYRVFWPNGETFDLFQDVFVGSDCVLTIAEGNRLIVDHAGGRYEPAQRPGAKYFPTAFRATDGGLWLFYSSGEQECAICHRYDDASQGYRVMAAPLTWLGPVSLCGVTLADGRTELAWCNGPEEQGADMARAFVELGVGMVPFAVTPIPPIPPIPPEPPIMPVPAPQDRVGYEDACADLVHTVTKMDRAEARQGIHEGDDKIDEFKLSWDGFSSCQAAFLRTGKDPIIIPDEKMRLIARGAADINARFLYRR